jgi:hypothetical protein
MELYEKKYKEALERMKSWARGEHPECFTEAQKAAEFIFPELKESEDEKIRKELLAYCKNRAEKYHNDPKYKNISAWIAWLEKQGEQKPDKIEPKFKVKYANSEYNVLEIKEIAGVTYYGIEDEPNHIDYVLPDNCEIVSEKKPANKVEPKFKNGQWIVSDKNNVVRIKSIDSNYYVLENTMRFTIDYVDKCWHLWTIQDAKDGDVLVHNGCTFIFMGIKNGIVQALEENFLDGANPVCFGEPDKDNDYHPATKEQKELLFNKIRENGFEYDSKKNRYIKKKRVPKEYAIIIDGVRHNLINPKIEDCKKCSLDKFCDKFKEALCDSLVGSHTGMIFEKAE